MKKFLAGFFLIGFWFNGLAQGNKCEETLSAATEQFGAGHFFEIPALLKPCIDNNSFTSEQKVRAYLLLTQTYLILESPADAETSYLKLLKADPEYVATEEKDPIDVVYLSKKFTSTPIFTPHARVGINTSFFRTVDQITLQGTKVNTIHGLRPGFQAGAGFDFNINNNWSLCAEGNVSTKSFKLTQTFNASDEVIGIEKRLNIDIPLYLKFAVDNGKIRPFGYAGAASNLLLSDKVKLVLNNRTGPNLVVSQGPDVDFAYQRKKVSWSFILGGGLKYKIGKDYVYADVRYMFGVTNLTTANIYAPKSVSPVVQGSSGLSFQNQTNDQLTRYGDVSNYFRLDNLSLSFGYIKPIYDPRKIRKIRVARIFHLFDKKTNVN